MSEANNERMLVQLVREIADDMGLDFKSFSHDWILQLAQGETKRHIFGYNFEINSATAHMLASDKAATSSLLKSAGLPHVEHKFFLHARLHKHISGQGNWDPILDYAKQHGYPLVIKPNEGTGGNDVTKVENQLELEQCVTKLFGKTREISISPYVEIEQEYRAILLDDEVMVIYAKMRPTLIGNGQASIIELLQRKSIEQSIPQSLASKAMESYEGRLSHVLEDGEKLPLNWKHNLGGGAVAQIVAEEELEARIVKLAIQAAQAIGIRFASIDIVRVEEEMRVLEINAGIMMENFSENYPDKRDLVKGIYTKAIQTMFAA